MKKLTLIFLLLVIALAGFGRQHSAHVPSVTFGNIQAHLTTKKQILENPQLICHGEGCEVKGFSILIYKQYDKGVIGPYYMNGSRLTDKVINTLQALPNKATTIYIDSVQIIFDNKTIEMPKISFQYGS